jgi:hypothetical protein
MIFTEEEAMYQLHGIFEKDRTSYVILSNSKSGGRRHGMDCVPFVQTRRHPLIAVYFREEERRAMIQKL